MRRAVLTCSSLRSHRRVAFYAITPYPVKSSDGDNQPDGSHHVSLHNLRAGELPQDQLDRKVNQQLERQKLGDILNELWHEGERHKLTGEQQDQRVIKLVNRIDARRPEGERCDGGGKQKA